MNPRQIIVIGAGAAGLVAASQAARGGASVILLEKNSKTGVKILMSGGTRCNLTHDTDARGITSVFGRSRRFLQPSVGRFPPQDVVQMFQQLGVATKLESTGKIFPASDRAVDVRDALQRQAIQAGVRLRLRQSVVALRPGGNSAGGSGPGRGDGSKRVEVGLSRWQVTTADQTYDCDAVIVTAGGKSWPRCGTTGDAYDWLSSLGHTIIRPRPALVPLVGGTAWMQSLSGITLGDCVATIRTKTSTGAVQSGKKGVLIQRRSSLLLTHFGLSGPAAMDVSGTMTAAKQISDLHLELDLVPATGGEELNDRLATRGGDDGRRSTAGLVADFLPQRLADGVVDAAGARGRLAELSAKKRHGLVASLKHLSIPVTGTRGFDKAEVTAGGVALAEVDPRTMQSRLHPGLYIAGEVLDVDGWIGGYNFQAAFSTGYAAGTAAAMPP